jgi:endonuclease V-like protein UPF0215 family
MRYEGLVCILLAGLNIASCYMLYSVFTRRRIPKVIIVNVNPEMQKMVSQMDKTPQIETAKE